MDQSGDWSSVPMGCGGECVTDWATGNWTTQWSFAVNLASQLMVCVCVCVVCVTTACTPLLPGAYVIEDANLFGVSSLDLVIGEVHCIGTEPGLLECSHGSIGYHLCSDSVPDIAISCYGSPHHTHKHCPLSLLSLSLSHSHSHSHSLSHTHTHTHTLSLIQ